MYCFYICIALLFITIAIVSFYKNEMPLAYLFSFLTLIPLWGSLIDRFIIIYKLKKSPFFNNNISVKIDQDGLHNSDNHSNLDLSWSAITKSRKFCDGFMLFTGPNIYNWLPDSSLMPGEKDQLEKIAEKHIIDYKFVQ